MDERAFCKVRRGKLPFLGNEEEEMMCFLLFFFVLYLQINLDKIVKFVISKIISLNFFKFFNGQL